MLKNKFITPDKLYEKILIKYVIIKKGSKKSFEVCYKKERLAV